ncbi:MAG: GAF domain-containing protein [Thermomicrobia bacterium]|nr:GAF domain-containing protein [Thermomicrobia bacterium]
MNETTGNDLYQEYIRRLPIAVPTLDRARLDRAIAGLGATPATVTEEQMLRALRETVYPLLATGNRVATEPPCAGLITTDASNHVRAVSQVAATIVGLAPDVDVVGQLVDALPGLDRCVPPVDAFADAASVRIAESVIPADGRRVRCISHLRTAADGTVLGVSTTVQDITLETAIYAEAGPLYQRSETRAEELAALANIARLTALTTSLDATLAAITERTAQLLDCRAAAIFLPNALGQLQLMGQYGLPDGYAETINAYMRFAADLPDEEQPPTTLAFRDGVPVHRNILIVPDDAPEGVQAARAIAITDGWGSIVAVPLIAKGTTIGTLTCYLPRQEPPSDEMLQRIITITDHAAIAVQTSKLYAETERQLAEMTALHQSAALLNSSLDRTDVLNTIVEQAARVTGARVCGLLELSSSGDATIPRAIYGLDHFPFSDVAILQHGPALYAIQQRQPLIIRNHTEAMAMPWWRKDFAEQVEYGQWEAFDAKAFIAVPFGYQGAHNAVLMLVYDHPINPGASELQLIATFADHAAVAMHNALLYEQAQQAAALEERHRLARDLHDSVTQSLFSMSLLAQVLPALWEVQPEEAKRSLDELRRLSKEALAEMRALLFQLRPVALEEEGVVEALRRHIESLQRRDGPALVFTATGSDQRLPLPFEEALFRIASEGVSNALKHAHAKEIVVSLDIRDGAATLTVRDDGRGFDRAAHQPQPGHLGLPGMRERVERIGGLLTIESAPGAGTTITVRGAIPATHSA